MSTKKILIIIICILLLTTFPYKSIRAQNFLGLINIVRSITSALKTINNLRGLNIFGYIPHSFPFGGHITSSERACSLKAWIWIPNPLLGGLPTPCPNCFYWPLIGRAIEVGPPVPTNGKVITFPWISDIYRNHSENRAGPWALGLGFTPFPLGQINSSIDSLIIPLPFGGWLDHFHFDCLSSGERDPSGNAIYKVILKLGTSP